MGLRASRETSRVMYRPLAAWVGGACALLSVLALPQEVEAQQVRRKFRDKIHVIQRKPVLQKKRFDIAPKLGYSLNDPLVSTPVAGGSASYHFTERVYLSGMFHWYNFGPSLSGSTELYEQVASQANSAADAPVVNYAGGLEVGFIPIFGKFSLFDGDIAFYDVALTVGGMWVDSASLQLTGGQGGPGATISLVNHIFLSEWVSLNFELRDTIYTAQLRGAADSVLSHMVTFSVGLGFYFPTTFAYVDASPDDEE